MRRRLNVPVPSRRGILGTAAGLIGAGLLGGCDRLANAGWGRRTLRLGEDANLYVQRLLLTPASLAREFPENAVSPWFKPNGTIDPQDKPYKALASRRFEGFHLRVDGLVERPQDFSLADLRALPARTQITRHDCVEGWSAIGKWTGVPVSELLSRAGLKPQARFVVLHCADTMEFEGGSEEADTAEATSSDQEDAEASSDKANADKPASSGALAWGGVGDGAAESGGEAKKTGNPDMEARPAGAENKASDSAGAEPEAAPHGKPIRYYESIDLTDAYHPQTILAYDMNGKPLPVSNGAPLRLRVERQLGYKQAKYVMRLEVVDSLAGFGEGKGGYWEDRGYEWYAGI